VKLKPPEPARNDMAAPKLDSPDIEADPKQRSGQPGILPAKQLFQGGQEILIDHQGEIYRLRITKNGKLILTK
jgi:hemin uptake protein HemP